MTSKVWNINKGDWPSVLHIFTHKCLYKHTVQLFQTEMKDLSLIAMSNDNTEETTNDHHSNSLYRALNYPHQCDETVMTSLVMTEMKGYSLHDITGMKVIIFKKSKEGNMFFFLNIDINIYSKQFVTGMKKLSNRIGA